MAEKLTTFNQLKMLVDRGQADSAARIAELAGLVAAGLTDAQHNGLTVTLPAADRQKRFFLSGQFLLVSCVRRHRRQSGQHNR